MPLPPRPTLFPYTTLFRSRRYYGSFVYFDGRGEMIPNENSYCEIDPGGTKDKWGIPVLRFHWQWSQHELRQAADRKSTRLNSSHSSISYAVFCLKKKIIHI